MQKTLDVIFTETTGHRPLAMIRNFPGGDTEITPSQLRSLAAALLQAADDSEAKEFNFRAVSKSYLLEWI